LSDNDAGPPSYEIPPELFALAQVDDAGRLFISPVIRFFDEVRISRRWWPG
jgi:hypothetical protein